MDPDGALQSVARGDQPEAAPLLRFRKMLLFVARLEAPRLRQDPDLEEVDGLALRRVELAVEHAGAGAHALDVARADDRARPHVVLVLERALEDVGEDLHVPVAVRGEALTRLDTVLVDDAQPTEAHVRRVVVVRERERVARVEPAVVEAAALPCLSHRNHESSRGLSMHGPAQALRPCSRRLARWRS